MTERYRLMLESLRGDEDLALEEFAELAQELARDEQLRLQWENLRRLDDRIRQRMPDVPVPAGLETRLLAALEVSKAADVSEAATADGRLPAGRAMAADRTESETDGAGVTPRGTARVEPALPVRWRRRSIWLGGLATAALVLLSLFAYRYWPRPPALTSETLAGQAVGWTSEINQLDWRGFDEEEFPELRFLRPRRHAVLRTDRFAVDVFDVSLRGGRVYLFRLPARLPEPLPPVPFQPVAASGAWRVGMWQERQQTFILVADSPELLDLFRRPVNTA